MLPFIFQTRALSDILSTIHKITNVAAGFRTLEDNYLPIPVPSMDKLHTNYCYHIQNRPEIQRRCNACDLAHLELARRKKKPLVYRCHDGLLDGVVPLFNKDGLFLGGLVFGQVRPRGQRRSFSDPRLRRLYYALPAFTTDEMRLFATLFKYICDYVTMSDLLQLHKIQWEETLTTYIDAHFSENITVKSLAQLIGRSPAFLCQNFKSTFGISPWQYVMKKRLARAAELLQQGNLVYEVARQLGFYDEFHFSKSFKAAYGHSPRHYIKQLKESE